MIFIGTQSESNFPASPSEVHITSPEQDENEDVDVIIHEAEEIDQRLHRELFGLALASNRIDETPRRTVRQNLSKKHITQLL